VLALTGLVNACYLLPGLRSLIDTRYGLELAVKLALFAAIVAIAAVNRLRLTPRLAAREPQAALRALARNALAEIVLGFAIVAIVGNLGVTMPPMAAS